MFRTWLRRIVVSGVAETDAALEDGLGHVQRLLDAIHPASSGCMPSRLPILRIKYPAFLFSRFLSF